MADNNEFHLSFDSQPTAPSASPTLESNQPAIPSPTNDDFHLSFGESPASSQPSYSPPSSTPSSPEAPSSDGFHLSFNNQPPTSSSQPQGKTSDANEPWYEKAWDFVNAPLIDEQQIEKWTGREGRASGLEKGFYDLLSGLTSPLSLALTIGTFGTGSLVDTGGMAALKAVGMATEDIATVTKGSEIMADAIKKGKDAWEALSSSGLDVEKVKTGIDALQKAGLTGEALANNGLIRTAGAAALRQAGVDISLSENIGRGVQTLVDAGFSLQNAYGAVTQFPRVLDAIKDGDYENAERFAVDAVGQGAFGYLGGKAAIKDAGSLMDKASSAVGLHVVPSEENLKLIKEFGTYDKDIATASRGADLDAESFREKYKDYIKNPQDLERIKKYIESGMDESVMRRRGSYLAAAADLPDLIHKDDAIPESTRTRGILGVPLKKDSSDFDISVEHKKGDLPLIKMLDKQGNDIGHAIINEVSPGVWEMADVSVKNPKQGFGTALYDEAAKYAQSQGGKEFVSSAVRTADSEGTWKSLNRQNPDIKSENGMYRYKLPENYREGNTILPSDKLHQIDEEGRIGEFIEKKSLKNSKWYDTEEKRRNLIDTYNPEKLTPEHKQLAKELNGYMADTFQQAHDAEVLDKAVENYSTNMWEKDDVNNDAANRLAHQARNGAFSTNTAMARHRVFQTSFEGELLGKKLAHTDPIALAAHNRNEFSRVIAARQTIERLADKGFKASDGRPMVAPSTSGYIIESENKNPALMINPTSIRNIKIDDKVIDGLTQTGELKHLIENGSIVKLGDVYKFPQTGTKLSPEQANFQPTVSEFGIGKDNPNNVTSPGTEQYKQPVYAWNTQNYRNIDHPALRDWRYVTKDSGNAPVFVKTDMKVHPEAFDYLNKRLGKAPEQNVAKKAILGASREAKGILLAWSPFHVFQEGLRAVMTGISPFGIDKWDLRTDPLLARGVESGLTLGRDLKGVESFEEGRMAGHSKIVSKVPGLGQLQDWLQTFLFDKYVPSLKSRAFKDLYQRYKESYPEWSNDKVLQTAAEDTNERFGGINYQRMGRSVATQDTFRMVALAPDWLESEMRFMARTFGDEGKIARADVAKMAVGLFLASRVLNYITTGKPHMEAPFGVALKDKDGKEKVYSIRTLPTDMIHAVSDPGGFLSGRVAPLMRTAVQTYTGRDEFGRKIPHQNMITNLVQTVSPIPAQTLAKSITGETPDVTNVDAGMKAAGFTVYPYRSEAEKLAAQKASDHTETGAVDPALLRQHQLKMKFEDDLRSGKMQPQELYSLVENGQLSVKDGKDIINNIKETQGLHPEYTQLYTRATRLPMADFIDVWDRSTNEEKAALSKLLIKKRNSYYKKVFKDLTPQQRLSDPTYRRLRSMFPQDAPF